MKKILSILFLMSAFIINAQSTSPRFGTAKNQDNTGRVITYGTATVTPSSTLVTIPTQTVSNKLVTIASTSISPTFTANVSSSYYGDQMDLYLLANATGTRTITLSTNIRANAATTQTLAASKQLTMRFIFDGAKWVEISRSVEP